MSASLIGRLGSSAFRLSTSAVSTSLAGSRFSSESAPRPSHKGFENEVEQSNGRPCRQTNGRSSGHCELTSSIVPRGTSCHHEVELVFLLSDLIMYSSHAATAFLLQRNSAPSIQMRCMMTAKRRASATIAFFMPRRLAICIAQALSQDHFVERTSMLWAAS